MSCLRQLDTEQKPHSLRIKTMSLFIHLQTAVCVNYFISLLRLSLKLARENG